MVFDMLVLSLSTKKFKNNFSKNAVWLQ